MNMDIEGRLDAAVRSYMEKALECILAAEGLEAGLAEVSLTVTGAEEIRELNRRYRDRDEATDVLSFPQFGAAAEIPADIPVLLGDVVINEERARAQSREYGHSFEREMVYLFTHSVLHLLGYDHMTEEDRTVMRKREEEIMEKVGLAL